MTSSTIGKNKIVLNILTVSQLKVLGNTEVCKECLSLDISKQYLLSAAHSLSLVM